MIKVVINERTFRVHFADHHGSLDNPLNSYQLVFCNAYADNIVELQNLHARDFFSLRARVAIGRKMRGSVKKALKLDICDEEMRKHYGYKEIATRILHPMRKARIFMLERLCEKCKKTYLKRYGG